MRIPFLMQDFIFSKTNIFIPIDILLAATGQELSVCEIRGHWDIGSEGGGVMSAPRINCITFFINMTHGTLNRSMLIQQNQIFNSNICCIVLQRIDL